MEDDRAVLERQLGRSPRAFRRVVRRCPFGRPAVTEQAPYDVGGNPFPTTYYLTCPHLVAEVSRLEAAGGVERWIMRAAAEPELAASLAAATEDQRSIRRRLAEGRTGPDGGAASPTDSAVLRVHGQLRFSCLQSLGNAGRHIELANPAVVP